MASSSEELAADAACAAKARGNAHFKAKEYAEAIAAYTEAIDLEASPEMHVLYSNRSGAYLAAENSSISKALKDAEKCVELAPEWAKGYGRLGAAQHALGRFAEAQATYWKALSLEPGREAYEAGLAAAKEGEARATKRRIAEEEEKARQEAAAAAAAREAQRAQEENDAALGEFFAAIGDDERRRKRAKSGIQDKYATQDLGTAAAHLERLTHKHAEFKNLNPFWVLRLDTDASPDDVKMRYRKLSALCHPDKNAGDDRARPAFEAVKTAYQTLLDEKKRDRAILVVQGARERAKLKASGNDDDLAAAMDREIMKTFAQNEMKRRDVEEHKRAAAARERMQEAEAKKKEEEETELESRWNQDDRRAQRIDFWQQFQDDAHRAGAQKRLRTAKNFKPQTHNPTKTKHGEVKLETWRKDWK
ncbi:hypothetical protein CTAYLR_000940 [Chrysophaeum taylorii]|uniref:J domain-containing protein n=1 Tax=Chrysophaeum taylorii TaxID=2483200 RepID=A0AAD7UFG3_9STRA|nr:hypothetical protein CTAYLR_000940 [Chrysophaeum taylorii]